MQAAQRLRTKSCMKKPTSGPAEIGHTSRFSISRIVRLARPCQVTSADDRVSVSITETRPGKRCGSVGAHADRPDVCRAQAGAAAPSPAAHVEPAVRLAGDPVPGCVSVTPRREFGGSDQVAPAVPRRRDRIYAPTVCRRILRAACWRQTFRLRCAACRGNVSSRRL
jgi:hypothetical protein